MPSIMSTPKERLLIKLVYPHLAILEERAYESVTNDNLDNVMAIIAFIL